MKGAGGKPLFGFLKILRGSKEKAFLYCSLLTGLTDGPGGVPTAGGRVGCPAVGSMDGWSAEAGNSCIYSDNITLNHEFVLDIYI
jgi:hypothetical protein